MSELLFATIGTVYNDGVSLIFDGTNEATSKHYKCNSTVTFYSGDRVKILRDSGTCVVEYPVGNPGGSGTSFFFYINGNQFRSNDSTTWTTWVGTSFNTEGYQLSKINNVLYLAKNGNKVAYVGKNTDLIIPTHNYTLNYDHFSIAGIQQNFYVGLTGSEWISATDLNTSGYILQYSAGTYYFKLNGTNVAVFGSSGLNLIEKDRNYT